MKKIAVLSAAALLGVGALTSTGAEARGRGGAIAAGVIGGLAVGGLLGAAATNGYGYGGGYGGGYGYGAPSYGYAAPAYGYGAPAYGYGGGYRSVGYDDGYYAPRPRRVIRSYDYDYGYGGGYSWGGPVYQGYGY